MTCHRPTAILIFLLGLMLGQAQANELFQAAPIDEVSVRSLPGFTVIETENIGTLDGSWAKGFRLGARYAALAHSNLNTPGIITFPDWDKAPTAAGNKVHVLVQILLDPLPNLPRVQDSDAVVRQLPATSVACYAMQGAYSAASFETGLKKIQDYLKAKGLPQSGPPRYLYYSTTDFGLSWWRVSEVQVPVGIGGGN